MSSPYPHGEGYGRPSGDGWYGADPQPWDPAYPHPTNVLPPYGYGYQPHGPAAFPPPPGKPRHSRGLVGAVVVLALALVASLVALGVVATRTTTSGTAVAGGSSLGGSTGNSSGNSSGGSSGGSPGGSSGGVMPGPYGQYPFPNPNSNGSGSSSASRATAAQQVGVVDIDTVIDYGSGEAAGTGMVLTSDGDVLTNNHVIDGATSIKVRIVSTGKTYTARLVGDAPTKDVAVIHLVGASGLTTANFGDSGTVAVGNKVVGVGNAGGTGGTPSAASGTVTALHRTITASDESASNSETLHNVIVTNAPIQAGDSGGPLYDSNGHVIGIDTAASTSGTAAGFAIPINDALSIASQIQKGAQTATIHIGYPGFLGVSIAPSAVSGALVEQTVQGGPAAQAGITSGDVITRVDGTRISNSSKLRTVVSAHDPGSKVSVTYLGPNGGTHTVTVTLATGPAD